MLEKAKKRLNKNNQWVKLRVKDTVFPTMRAPIKISTLHHVINVVENLQLTESQNMKKYVRVRK